MSMRAMERVEECDLPANVRSVLLVIADQAGEFGDFRIEDTNRFRAYIAWRTGLVELVVADTLNQLEELGWLRAQGAAEFHIDLSDARRKPPFEEYLNRPFDPDDWEMVSRDVPFAGAAERLKGHRARFDVPQPIEGGYE